MLTTEEVFLTKRRNKRRIKELIRVSFGLGVNLTAPTPFKESLRLLNVILVVTSLLAMYGHWSLFRRHIHEIPKITETICTAFQTTKSIMKMVYYLFIQRRLYELLEKVQAHDFLQRIDVFYTDLDVKGLLKVEIGKIMEDNWRSIRRQVMIYLCCCTAIMSNYFFVALFINLYHYVKETPNYHPLLPFPSVYPIWEDKGMAFPYYPIEMFLEGSALYIAGMCGISFDGVFIVLCAHGVSLVKVLNLMMRMSTCSAIPPGRRVEYLRYCIYQYQRVQEYILEMDGIYKHISFLQFLISMIVWGIVIFQMNIGIESDVVTLVRMLMYIAAAFCEILLYCTNAQDLTSSSEETSLALYTCDWYNESEEFKELLRMMIIRTNRAFRLNLSWFFTMSMATLMAMVKTSGSYFLLLKNLAE